MPAGSRHKLSDVSFSVKRGEIVGIAGVEGNGQSELLQAILHPREPHCRTSGTVSFLGEDVTAYDALKIRDLGVAVIPGRPSAGGIAAGTTRGRKFSARVCSAAPSSIARGFSNSNGVRRRQHGRLKNMTCAREIWRLLAGRLSGGNQQKLVVAREFQRRPRVLIAAQPTRGVDVGAIEFIHQRIVRARDEGAGVLLVSSELDEILTLSDRILVMYEGRIAAEFSRGEVSERELGLKMGGS